jgi:hypothetical protein
VEFAISKREKERRKGRLKISICMHWGRAAYWRTLSNSCTETDSSPPDYVSGFALSLLLGGVLVSLFLLILYSDICWLLLYAVPGLVGSPAHVHCVLVAIQGMCR